MTMTYTIPTHQYPPTNRQKAMTRSQIRERILEMAQRGGCDRHQVDAMLEDWVHMLLADALREYTRLFKAHWPEECDDEYVPREFREYAGNWMEGTRSPHVAVRSPNWPWPITEIMPSRTPGMPTFERAMSALRVCGYRVGKTSGMPQAERLRFLAYFFTHELPSQVAGEFGDEYGEPGSEARLKKMADVIASACRNTKRRRDGADYDVAIADWEGDLAYLKREFYDRFYEFEWPATGW